MNAEAIIDASALVRCDEADAQNCAIAIERAQTTGCDGQQTSDAIYAAGSTGFQLNFILGKKALEPTLGRVSTI